MRTKKSERKKKEIRMGRGEKEKGIGKGTEKKQKNVKELHRKVKKEVREWIEGEEHLCMEQVEVGEGVVQQEEKMGVAKGKEGRRLAGEEEGNRQWCQNHPLLQVILRVSHKYFKWIACDKCDCWYHIYYMLALIQKQI